MQVIIPCAGKSSRFPDTRPKYLLTMPDGRLMLQHVADGYLENGHTVHFIIIKEHSEMYESEYAIRNIYGDNVFIHVMDDFTSGPAETVHELIKDWKDTPFVVHDCDSFFEYDMPTGSYLSYVDLSNYPNLHNVAAKSFIIHEDGIVKNIIEKRISSGYICVGAYGFESSDLYNHYYTKISRFCYGEIFLSHVVKEMLENDIIFYSIEANDYVDCGTYDAFIDNMRDHLTIFCDIDGVIFKNQSHYFKNNYANSPTENPQAIEFIKNKISKGATVIFTTARPEKYKDVTEQGLRDAGIEDFQVIYGLPHAPRLLINDVTYTNPWPSASSINVPRDDDDYWRMFKL